MSVVHQLTVQDPIGLHARPVGQIVAAVKESGLTVSLQRPGGPPFAATSALKMLSMKVKAGEPLEVVVDTNDSDTGLLLAKNIEALINQG
jgi:phosphotransferase system HPr (HPr) family protein